jgi:hypothetical protein
VLLQALTSHRDERVVPLFIYILEHSARRGDLEPVHAAAVGALGKSSGDADTVAILKKVLYRREWLAPLRTARLRTAAAAALRSADSALAQQALEEAAREGPRGVRRAARNAMSAGPRRIPPRRTS